MRLAPRLLSTAVLGLAVVASALAQAPSAPSAAIPLARYIPSADLFAYVEFQGVDAHADAWKATAASKILNDTTTGAMLEDIFSQAFNAQIAKLAPRARRSTSSTAFRSSSTSPSRASWSASARARRPRAVPSARS